MYKRMLAAAVVIVSFGLVSRAGDDSAANRTDPATSAAKPIDNHAHEGVWKPVSAVLRDENLPDASIKAITLKITSGNYEITLDGKSESDKGTVELDTSTSPKRMTIKSTHGPNRGKTIFAIYDMKDADSMRVCYDLSSAEFPKEFNVPKDSTLFLVSYRRQKEQPAEKPPEKAEPK